MNLSELKTDLVRKKEEEGEPRPWLDSKCQHQKLTPAAALIHVLKSRAVRQCKEEQRAYYECVKGRTLSVVRCWPTFLFVACSHARHIVPLASACAALLLQLCVPTLTSCRRCP
jgi:hypothetical protein